MSIFRKAARLTAKNQANQMRHSYSKKGKRLVRFMGGDGKPKVAALNVLQPYNKSKETYEAYRARMERNNAS